MTEQQKTTNEQNNKTTNGWLAKQQVGQQDNKRLAGEETNLCYVKLQNHT